MLLTLQEALEYIEKEYKFLEELNLITIASQRRYKRIQCKISMKIVELLNTIQPELNVKKEWNEESYMHSQTRFFPKEEIVQDIYQSNNEQGQYDIMATNEDPQANFDPPSTNVVVKQEHIENQTFAATTQRGDMETKDDNYSVYQQNESNEFTERGTVYEAQKEFSTDLTKSAGKYTSNHIVCGSDSTRPAEQVSTHKSESPKEANFPFQNIKIPRKSDESIDPVNDTVEGPGSCEMEIPTKKPDKKINTKGRRFTCDFCNKKFTTKQILQRHTVVHTGEKPFECAVCQKAFNANASLRNHMFIHTGEKPFECEICFKKFSHITSLKSHMLSHSGAKPFKCDVCHKRFQQSGHLKNHKISHTGEKPYTCEICEKKFSLKQSLRTHMFIHTNEKNIKCEFCDKTFHTERKMRRHKKSHSDSSHAECGICKKQFRRKESMKTHMQIHSGEKPFKCDICHMAFRVKSYLKTHQVTHTGEKPFKCNICQNSFTLNQNLKTHMILHNEKQFQCDVCQRKFALKRYLKKHIRKYNGSCELVL